ncbi:hypothetical protein AQUCO_01700679v1 [Aquilegia coerulea]|uniref:DUF668 domain-containing protein n=1 Tax=Aquilegia coerulea TaxID=218851 RepID=A0A2G5DP49_AQUCA|nr:hypothetical protein AQUCO_01700679v1 [Aquilegia coerulea]PIA45306.1 hypothetical protein AQUCO_01700679v1 [Aquilegia coerulea]
MVAEPWIIKMGNQVSNNLKHALFIDSAKKKNSKKTERKETIGILSFEVANVMSKVVHLHKSLTDNEVFRLKNEILKSDGVINLVSSDESYLLELALAEKLDDLYRIVAVVSRLGKRCSEPALHGFEHVFADIMSGVIDVRELGFLVKDMEGMIRKMEKYVNSTSNLYNETQVLSELEQTSKKFQQNQHEESRRVFEQKLLWQRQDVRHLKDMSLWNQTYDKIVGLLARTICTVYARLYLLFGDSIVRTESSGLSVSASEFCSAVLQNESGLLSGSLDAHRHRQMASGPLQPVSSRSSAYDSGPMGRREISAQSRLTSHRNTVASFRPEDMSFPCGSSPGRLFTECLRLSSSASLKLNGDFDHERPNRQTLGCCSSPIGLKREHHLPSDCSTVVEMNVPFSGDQRRRKCSIPSTSRSHFGPKSRLMVYASPSTVGGSALALHYANVIIVIEKLLRYPHLVGDEARDDLYQMLPTSLRVSLKTNLKSYAKNMSIYDAPLAHEWKDTLDKMLRWLAPLAHNMIRWQTERNLEQQQIIARTNVLLLQTLYFADREKTEAAICKLLVGLNYICRYEHQQNALLDCASSFDFDDCVEWRWHDQFL